MSLKMPCRWGAFALISVFALVSCDGDNLFNGGGADTQPPSVTVAPTPTASLPGTEVQVRVTATDDAGLSRIGFAAIDALGDTIGGAPTMVATSGITKDTTFTFLIPGTVAPGTVRLIGIAEDLLAQRSISTVANLTIADAVPPVITMLAPGQNTTAPLHDSVRVSFRIQDATGVKSVRIQGLATRVDSLGPTVVVPRYNEKTIEFTAPLPRDTIIIRYLLATNDNVSEPVDIIVTATDSLNNTAEVEQTILVGGPRVELRSPQVNAPAVVPGGTLQLHAFAIDRSSPIDSVRINISGAQTATFGFGPACAAATCQPFGLPADSVNVRPTYIVGSQVGTLTINAIAYNRNRVAGAAAPVTVTVAATAQTDNQPPLVRRTVTASDRLELSDTIAVSIDAQDQGAAGLRRLGIVAIATPAGTGLAPDTLFLDTTFTGSGRTGLQASTFKFTLEDFGFNEVNMVRLPRDVNVRVHAFAVDTVGNCGASVTSELTALQCASITAAGRTFFMASNTVAAAHQATVVPGFAVRLPTSGSRIADIAVDMNAGRPRMYLSNHNFNRLEVLSLLDSTFAAPVTVGSEPWGLFVNNAGDRLIVANSGGTNISMVDITQPAGSIAEADRILTPNASLFDVSRDITNGSVNYIVTIHDFSDRPQFIAQDANGTILHSTKPTGAAPNGSVRYLEETPVGSTRRYESKILFNDGGTSPATENWAIAHIDSITDGITLWDHVPGRPDQVFAATHPNIDSAIVILRTAGSDIFARRARIWNLEEVGLSDTTFVATSTDRQFVAFGEGAVSPFASIWLWHCAPLTATCTEGTGLGPGSLTDEIEVDDLIGNAAERVLGVALDSNGRIGGARGSQSAYFFSNDVENEGDLRLQGVFGNGVAGGSGGLALHPSHVHSGTSSPVTLAFVATANRSIKIADTHSFIQRGEILIRNNIVGPLRASLPLASENVGLSECNQIWVKLYGVTDAGNAVIINVRKKDVVNPIITTTACPL